MIEDLILQAKNINCFETANIDPFIKKTNILNMVLNEIDKIPDSNIEYAKKMLVLVENVIYNYGYEVSYNFVYGREGGKYWYQILPKLVALGEKFFTGKELIPFLQEKLYYTWEESERSGLYRKINELENNM